MSSATNPQPKSSTSAGIGMKVKGGVQVAKGLGHSVRGTTMSAIDSVEHRDSSGNDEIARRGRMEIDQGIAMIKGRSMNSTTIGSHDAAAQSTGPAGNSLQGIDGANANATTNSTAFPPLNGQEHAANSTTATNMKSDLGKGPNAFSGNNLDQQPPPQSLLSMPGLSYQYPAPGGPSVT
ncbi:hypothetical protein B0H13DRAFT_1972003 [Mycena leptocephala]|nr:hypothetical protein B0H13DRAFT_2151393 [Mycena leptocephala]KAJ7926845.1 hypothetical protein B0H13DRAFT_1972003 [Mycena leptocephala]